MSWVVKPYLPEDYLAINERLPFPMADAQRIAAEYARGRAYTGWAGDVPVGCAGLLPMWPGVATAWALLAPDVPAHAKRVHGAVLRGLSRLMREMDLRRIEATVFAGHAAGRRWVEHLGFREESAMPLYGPNGELASRYVLFPKEWTK